MGASQSALIMPAQLVLQCARRMAQMNERTDTHVCMQGNTDKLTCKLQRAVSGTVSECTAKRAVNISVVT